MLEKMKFSTKLSKKCSSKYELENDENIFHQKCTKQHCLNTESVSIDGCDEITLMPVKKIKFFYAC